MKKYIKKYIKNKTRLLIPATAIVSIALFIFNNESVISAWCCGWCCGTTFVDALHCYYLEK